MQEVVRNLVKRYVAAMIRDAKTEEGLTEENFKVGRVPAEERRSSEYCCDNR